MKAKIVIVVGLLIGMIACTENAQQAHVESKEVEKAGKEVIYQVFTRLFGNTNTTNKPWGTIEENGVGKFSDFSDKALREIKDLGVSYIWYTGVPHHDVIRDYTAYGISDDDPDVVKGRAGSPYAVKDYYNVNPDLAENPENRLAEFEELIKRTHKVGLKLLIDIVPNHVARNYKSLSNPPGTEDFGASDDKTVQYHKNNNFYYNPGEKFEVPEWKDGYEVLGGEKADLIDGKFDENPAKWTGNGSRLSRPNMYDWYETVKINYGVDPEGKKEFAELPEGFDKKDYKAHFEFWKDKEIPDSWVKFRDIALYWLEKGVDGFRFDMAEMVPVEFWSFMNSSIKMKNEDAFLLAEVYNPSLYRDYLFKGKMDYLYDKVALYDTIKHIIRGHGLTDNLPKIQDDLADIEHHMLHFLENHDEQRIASPEFAGYAEKAIPAMLVSTTISTSPTMIYFGQEVGEPGAQMAGFGKPSRTSIFDYIGVPKHQQWMNDKKFDGGQLSEKDKRLRSFYKKLLNFSIQSEALMGAYEEIHTYNRQFDNNYNHKLFSFVRWAEHEKLIILTNFDDQNDYATEIRLPSNLINEWKLKDGSYQMNGILNSQKILNLIVKNGEGILKLTLEPLAAEIYRISEE